MVEPFCAAVAIMWDTCEFHATFVTSAVCRDCSVSRQHEKVQRDEHATNSGRSNGQRVSPMSWSGNGGVTSITSLNNMCAGVTTWSTFFGVGSMILQRDVGEVDHRSRQHKMRHLPTSPWREHETIQYTQTDHLVFYARRQVPPKNTAGSVHALCFTRAAPTIRCYTPRDRRTNSLCWASDPARTRLEYPDDPAP